MGIVIKFTHSVWLARGSQTLIDRSPSLPPAETGQTAQLGHGVKGPLSVVQGLGASCAPWAPPWGGCRGSHDKGSYRPAKGDRGCP